MGHLATPLLLATTPSLAPPFRSPFATAPEESKRPKAEARLRRLLGINFALNTFGDTEELLHVITQAVTDVADCEAASILLYDEEAKALRFEAASGSAGPALVGTMVPLEGSLAGAIFREGRPLYAPDASVDARHFRRADQITGFRTRALLGVPMRIDGQPVGVIEVLNSRHGGFDEGDAEALLVVAAQAAIALRASLHSRALRELNDRLAQLDRLKTNFLEITSHELRTPLTSVRGFGQILAEEVPDSLRPYAEAVVRAGYRMTDVVQTLDVMASLDGDLGAHPARRVDVLDILHEAVRALPKREGEIRVHFPQRLFVEGNGPRIRLAFNSLLKNAVQFSPAHAPITVKGRIQGRVLHLTVEDEGRGLEADDLEQIFEAYAQVQDPDHRDHEGLGVGLTVARAVAVQHGGQLWAESPGVGQGSTFHLLLPLLR